MEYLLQSEGDSARMGIRRSGYKVTEADADG